MRYLKWTFYLVIPYLAAFALACILPASKVEVARADVVMLGTTEITGYTVFQRSLVSPKYLQVRDSTGSMQVLNPGPVPSYPPTFKNKICYSANFDLYSGDSKDRLEVWQDMFGTASISEILSVCPQLR